MADFEDPILYCAGCGSAYLHQYRVEIYFRKAEGDAIGTHVDVKTGSIVCDEIMTTNPSPRRDGLRVIFFCEHCEAITVLTIFQHSGQTIAGLEVTSE